MLGGGLEREPGEEEPLVGAVLSDPEAHAEVREVVRERATKGVGKQRILAGGAAHGAAHEPGVECERTRDAACGVHAEQQHAVRLAAAAHVRRLQRGMQHGGEVARRQGSAPEHERDRVERFLDLFRGRPPEPRPVQLAEAGRRLRRVARAHERLRRGGSVLGGPIERRQEIERFDLPRVALGALRSRQRERATPAIRARGGHADAVVQRNPGLREDPPQEQRRRPAAGGHRHEELVERAPVLADLVENATGDAAHFRRLRRIRRKLQPQRPRVADRRRVKQVVLQGDERLASRRSELHGGALRARPGEQGLDRRLTGPGLLRPRPRNEDRDLAPPRRREDQLELHGRRIVEAEREERRRVVGDVAPASELERRALRAAPVEETLPLHGVVEIAEQGRQLATQRIGFDGRRDLVALRIEAALVEVGESRREKPGRARCIGRREGARATPSGTLLEDARCEPLEPGLGESTSARTGDRAFRVRIDPTRQRRDLDAENAVQRAREVAPRRRSRDLVRHDDGHGSERVARTHRGDLTRQPLPEGRKSGAATTLTAPSPPGRRRRPWRRVRGTRRGRGASRRRGARCRAGRGRAGTIESLCAAPARTPSCR